MATRLRKVRRLRGSRTHGWGQIGQHRRTGAKGGSGMAGLHKHKWSYLVKYMPDHFGSNKWHPPHPSVTRRWINVGDLERVTAVHQSQDDASNGGVLDLSELGYDKLLGQGSVSKPMKLKVGRASSSAVEKVKAAGGSVEVEISREAEESEKRGEEIKKGAEKPRGASSASKEKKRSTG